MSEEMWSRKEFKIIALASLGISLAFLVIYTIYISLASISNSIIKLSTPTINIANIIGSTILNIIGNNPLLFGIFFFIVTAAIFGVGYFIKNEDNRNFYQLLIYLSWFITPLVILFLTAASASESVVVGLGFLVYLLPIYSLIAYKGLKPILKFKKSEWIQKK